MADPLYKKGDTNARPLEIRIYDHTAKTAHSYTMTTTHGEMTCKPDAVKQKLREAFHVFTEALFSPKIPEVSSVISDAKTKKP